MPSPLRDFLESIFGASYRTAINAFLGILGLVLIACYHQWWDGDPTVNPDWLTLISTLFLGAGIYAARDNTVSSADLKKNNEMPPKE